MTPLQRRIQQIRKRRIAQQQLRKKRQQQQRLKKKKLEQKIRNQRKIQKQKQKQLNIEKKKVHNKKQNVNNKQKLGDTHFYDGKIKEQYKVYRNYDEKNCVTFDYIFLLFNYNIVLDEISQFIQNYNGLNSTKLKKDAIKTIQLFKTKDKQNYDPKNDIHVNDILPRVWRFIKNENDEFIKRLFLEQIADISAKGACSQGRTTRLYQIYALYMDNLMV
tara:strand:+ start:229 stop:882 length:654 start_codon:yes stop_codon:yes gene_type:complete